MVRIYFYNNISVCSNNVFNHSDTGDTIMHIVVRYGSQNIYRYLIGMLIQSNKKCNSVIGPIDFEKEGTKAQLQRSESSDVMQETELKKNESK